MRGNITFIRDLHKKNYTCISNNVLRDKRLSAKARGILVQILSYPDYWILYKTGLQDSADKRSAISSGLKELVELGYMSISKNQDETLSYVIIENPKSDVQKQHTPAERDVENQQEDCSKSASGNVENQRLLNTDLNTNLLTTTKSIVSMNSDNEGFKQYVEETYELSFTEDFYNKLIQICSERKINAKDYFGWLYETKKNSARKLAAYLYKSACKENLINEYISIQKQHEKISKYQEPDLICPSCGHKFQTIDFITRKCICGLSLDEIQAKEGAHEK